MPVHAEPRPEIDTSNAPSGRSDFDETVAASAATDVSAVSGFGPPAADGEVGTLGPYRVVKELGRGGMGAVYAALDTRLDRRLALKVMLPQFAADAAAKGRFLREARAAAKISHDNVVTVYEADERQGVPYISMQFLEGYPLDEYLMKKGGPTVPQVLRIAAEAAAGLAAAHKIGLVHRDVKPGNLWLEAPNGRVKVLDFGLAKPVDAEVELTKSGAIVGTPAYMSPEQARGEKVDHRTDLFSLGAVMYRLCTGRLPFHGPTTMAVLMALGTEEPPPVREQNSAVPEPLAALIHQLLAKRADARPQSAAEVVKRVRAIAEALAAPRGQSAELSTSQPQLVPPPVVYVPMQVTAVAAANPFADLDDLDTERDSREPDEEPTAAAPVRKKPGGRWLWAAAGFAAFLAVVACGVIIIIKNKDGTETKIEVPDGATVTVKDKDGKTLAQVVPEKKTPPAADTGADRKAAEWAIGQGGVVRVNGDQGHIKAVADVPKERFTLTWVGLAGTKVADAGLEHFKELKGLTYLSLNDTQVSDAGLAHLKDLKGLTTLGLQRTAVSDAGLAHLKELKGLTILSLDATPVTDAGLGHLKELKGLTSLDLQATAVTDAGLVHLKELKGLTILSLDGTPVTDAGLAHLKEFKSLTVLNLTNTPVTDAGLAHIKELKGLTLLYLQNTKVTDAGLEHLKELKALTHLWLNGPPVSDAGLAHLNELKNLAFIDLRKTKVTAKGLGAFHAALPACKIEYDAGTIKPTAAANPDRAAAEWVLSAGGGVSVVQGSLGVTGILKPADLPTVPFKLAGVSLNGKGVTDAGLAHFKSCKSLTALNLYATAVTGDGLAHLKGCESFTSFTCGGGTPLTDAGLVHLAGLGKLESLGLATGNRVTDDGLAHLKGCKTLKSLNLVAEKVTEAGLAHLKECPALATLYIGGPKVTDDWLPRLKDLKGLTTLGLLSENVTDAGLAHLKELKGLTSLSLKKTVVTAKGAEDFHKAVPGCKVEYEGGTIEPKK